MAVKSWKNNWSELSTYFKYPDELRRIIYTTNTAENYHRSLRKVTKTKASFVKDMALLKILYLVTMDVTAKWTEHMRDWPIIYSHLNIYFGERIASYVV